MVVQAISDKKKSITNLLTKNNREFNEIFFQIHQNRGEHDVITIKALYPPDNEGKRRLYWIFASAFLLELKNISDHQLVLNLALQDGVTLIRWVDIFKSDDLVSKTRHFQKDPSIPALGIAVVLSRSIELNCRTRLRRDYKNPLRLSIYEKLDKREQLSISETKGKFNEEKKELITAIKSTGCTGRVLVAKDILFLFKRVNKFKHGDLAFFRNKNLLQNWIQIKNVPQKPLVDFPFQRDLPVSIPLGSSTRDPRHQVGFPVLEDKRVLITGGTADSRMILALKAAAAIDKGVIVFDLSDNLTTNLESWKVVLDRTASTIEPGNDLNINVFDLTPPRKINTASVVGYKAYRMAAFLVHASQTDDYYRLVDHVQALLSSSYGMAGTNTVTCDKLIDVLESGTSPLRSNSAKEELVTVLVNSLKDYPEINAPAAISLVDLIQKASNNIWLRFTYQPLRIKLALVLWLLHELAMNGIENYTIIIEGIEQLLPVSRSPDKNRVIVNDILPLFQQIALNNHVFLCCDVIERLHQNVFYSVNNAVYLKLTSDNAWKTVKSRHGFKIEAFQFETLKKIDNQGFLVREDRSDVPLVLNINNSEEELVKLVKKLSMINNRKITKAETGTKPVLLEKSDITKKEQDTAEFFFNRTGLILEPLPDDELVAQSYLETCQLLMHKKAVEENELRLLLAGMIDTKYRSLLDTNGTDTDDQAVIHHTPSSIDLGELEKPVNGLVSSLAKSNYFSVQYTEKVGTRKYWSLKNQGSKFIRLHLENFKYLLVHTDDFSLAGAIMKIESMIEEHGREMTTTLLINNRSVREELFLILRQAMSDEYMRRRTEPWKIYVFAAEVDRILQRLIKQKELDLGLKLLVDCQNFLQQLQLDRKNRVPHKTDKEKEHLATSSLSGTTGTAVTGSQIKEPIPFNAGEVRSLSEYMPDQSMKSPEMDIINMTDQTEKRIEGTGSASTAEIVETDENQLIYGEDAGLPPSWPYSMNQPEELRSVIDSLMEISTICNQECYPKTSLFAMVGHMDRHRLYSQKEELSGILDELFDYYQGNQVDRQFQKGQQE